MNGKPKWKNVSPEAAALVPRLERAVAAIDAPGDGPGFWAGAPSAVLADGAFYVAYRLRRPVGEGRGYAVVVARSDNGVHFEPLVVLNREEFSADSLERPALVQTEDGRWRLYVSCATPGTLHWRIEVLDADHPKSFSPSGRRVVLPGDEHVGVKDPVVVRSGGRWHLWASCHPLGDPLEADRMVTRYATSDDGLAWTWVSTALAGRASSWDERGVRVTSVLAGSSIAFYDGRASAAENTEERTGLAIGNGDGTFHAVLDDPVAVSPHGSGSLRYLSVVGLGDGGHRLFYEATNPDGAHSLYTEEVAATT
jgi:hypothetical protein